jgi:glycosyltransferase involved in cell wall biosynthesis
MSKKNPKVLVIATSRKTRGGITSVVKAHETGEQWKKYHCKWIETHRDGNNVRKIFYFIRAIILYITLLPFYDLVHIHVASYSSLKRKRYFLKLAKLFGKKTIAHFHPHKPEVIFDKSTQAEYISFFTSVDRVVVLSPQWQRWLGEALNLYDNIQVIFNPCPVVEIGIPDHSQKYILLAGTLYRRKGYDTLIKAFSKIANKYPDWKVIIAGNVKNPEEKNLPLELAKEFGVENQILFPGWVVGEAKNQMFRNASIFCLASSGEGFPMAVLDAWAYGVPVVCTPVGGLPDIVEEGKNAILFEYADVNRLAIQLEKLISDDGLRNKIANESLKFAKTTFAIDKINKEIEELYQRIINE